MSERSTSELRPAPYSDKAGGVQTLSETAELGNSEKKEKENDVKRRHVKIKKSISCEMHEQNKLFADKHVILKEFQHQARNKRK